MPIGVCKMFDRNRGYGFLIPDEAAGAQGTWRWTMPWYPTAKAVLNRKHCDWRDCVEQVAAELRATESPGAGPGLPQA
jgi:hypothetical protein